MPQYVGPYSPAWYAKMSGAASGQPSTRIVGQSYPTSQKTINAYYAGTSNPVLPRQQNPYVAQPSGSTQQPRGDVLGLQAPPTTTGPDPYQITREAYDAYSRELDAMLNETLPAQRRAQEGIVQSQLSQGQADLLSQKREGEELLTRQREKTEKAQSKSLKDIAADLKNAFMAGSVYLGALGAGDSSAANMYSYALTKLGSKQRGDIMTQTADIMNEIGDREARLQNIYTEEYNRLQRDSEQRILDIASWFAEQQQSIRMSKAENIADLSQTLLNQALSQVSLIQQEASNRRSALDQWAINNAKNLSQVKSNLQSVSAFQPAQPTAQPIAGAPSVDAGGNIFARAGYYPGGNTEEKLFT